ncbi:MAG: hypothetical protein HYW85_01840, partial [Deltaproteobacteria bacterium]|nr:hypothetical protein [Deltaproteobacteria bacterium]
QYHELNLAEVPDYCDLSQEACPEKLKELQPFFQNLYLSFQEKPIDPKPSITHGTPPKEFQDVCSELSGKLKKDFEKLEEQYRALDKEVWTYIVKPYDPVMRQKLKSGQETLRQLGKQKTCVYEAHARTAGTIESDSLWRVDLKLFEKNEKQVQECLGAYKRLYPTCYSTCAFTPKDCAEKLKDYPLYLLRLKSLSPLPDKKDKN